MNSWLPKRFLPRQAPIVATVHHAVHHPEARAYKGVVRAAYHRSWIAPNERRMLGRADVVVAVSEFVAKSSMEVLLDVPMEIIYNGVDTSIFCPSPIAQPSRDTFRVLYVGSWTKRKGIDLLPGIFRDLGEEFELRYTGRQKLNVNAPMPANARNIGRLLGDAAVVAAMQDADVLLLPSRSEGHPLVAIEAMACGLPVIAMRGSSLEEAISDGETGLLCERESPMAFVLALRKLAANEPLRAALSRQATASVAARFSEAAMITGYLAAYAKAICRFGTAK